MNVHRRALLKSSGTAIGLAALGGAAGARDRTTDADEFRAYWVDAFNDGFLAPDQVETTVERVVDANANAVVAQVVRRGDFFGDDALPPRTDEDAVADGFDPLEALIDEAHDGDVEVHAWMVCAKLWEWNQFDGPPSAADHVFNEHGPDNDDPWISRTADGDEHDGGSYYFDFGHPDAADYLVRTARSIVENYDVDGINLDYIRYPDVEPGTDQQWGYNEVALERFRDETGYEGTPVPGNDEWIAWRRRQVTNLVRRIYLECYDADPTVRVSADTIGWSNGPQERAGGWESTANYWQILQDWQDWMAEGILDTNLLMNYNREHVDEQADHYREWAAFAKDNQYDRDAVIGSAAYLNDAADVDAQIRVAKSASDAGNEAAGWAGYSYAYPNAAVNDGEQSTAAGHAEMIDLFTSSPPPGETDPAFAAAVDVPSMPWKAAPTTGHLSGEVVDGDDEPLTGVTVTVSDGADCGTGTTVAETETDGTGWYGFVDLEPGTYRVDANGDCESVEIQAGDLATVDFEPGDSERQPHEGPHVLPGRVQAQHFDEGGQGVAYYDTTGANQGGSYRPDESVDLEPVDDASGAYNVGWIDDGEWLEYTVEVDAAGTYDLHARVASGDGGGAFAVSVDGDPVGGTVTFDDTGGWHDWITVAVGDVSLSSGEHVIRVEMTDDRFNLNWLSATDPADGGFVDGDAIETSADVNTREQPGRNENDVLATLPADEPGQIVNGPIAADGYTWWGVHWTDRNVWGWTPEPWLEAIGE